MAEPSAIPLERRIHKRFPIAGRIPAVLADQDNNMHSFIGVDISTHGFGIVLNYKPTNDSILILKLEKPVDHDGGLINEIAFVVKWSIEKPVSPGIRRVGLISTDLKLDLLDIFKQFESVLVDEG